MTASTGRDRWHAIVLLARRDLHHLLFSPGIYVVLLLSMAGAGIVLQGYLNLIAREGIYVASRPFYTPLYTAVLLCSIYLALSSSADVAREKESGTLMVLFMGPLDHFSYVAGRFLARIAAFAVIQVLLALYFALLSAITQFAFSAVVWWGILFALFAVAGVVAFAIFLSTATGRVRSAILYLVIITAGLLALQGVDSLLGAMGNGQEELLVIGQVVHAANSVIQWVSPFSYLLRGLEAAGAGAWSDYALMLGGSLLYTTLFLVLAMRALRQKGVRP